MAASRENLIRQLPGLFFYYSSNLKGYSFELVVCIFHLLYLVSCRILIGDPIKNYLTTPMFYCQLLSLDKGYFPQPQVLCISNSKLVLHMLFAGQNHCFQRLNKFFHFFPSQIRKRRKSRKNKVKIHFNAEKDYFKQRTACKAPVFWSKYTTLNNNRQ